MYPAHLLGYSNPITHQEFTYDSLRNPLNNTGKRMQPIAPRPASRSGSASSIGCRPSSRGGASGRSVSPRSHELLRRIETLEKTLLEERQGRTQVSSELTALQTMLTEYVAAKAKV